MKTTKFYVCTFVCCCLLFACNNKHKNSYFIETPKPKPTFVKNAEYSVQVVGITDGDTFKGLTADQQEVNFRIYGIDAPEKKQAFGNRSKQYLSDLIFGKTITVKIQKKQDRYGRPVVWVFTPEGQDVSSEMLKAGMAWHYKRFDHSQDYAALETAARKAKIGLWQDKNPIAPWEFRAQKKKKD